MPEILIILALVAAIALLFRTLVRKASERIESQYARIAERFGLELTRHPPKLFGFVRPEPSVFGSHRGRELSISVPGKGLQNTRQVETVLKLELRDRRLKAEIAPTGMLGGLRHRDSGGKLRWRSGDAAFDAAVDLRTDSGHRLSALLTAERREWLMRALKAGKGTIYIGNGTLAYAEFGLIADKRCRERFEAMVEFLCDLAESVEADRPGHALERGGGSCV